MRSRGKETSVSWKSLCVYKCVSSTSLFLSDLLYVLTTMIIILIWCFSIDWSMQEAAKRSYGVDGRSIEALETDCDNGGLFKSQFGCCPHKECSLDDFPFHLRSGAANVVPPKICFNNTIIMGGVRGNSGQGLNIVIINSQTGKILRSNYFNLKSEGHEELLEYLKLIKPGNIILVASHINPETKLTDEIKDIFAGFGSTMIGSLNPMDSWVFAGAYGMKKVSPFEKLIQNDLKNNAYGDWPEMGEIMDCFPKV
ncbi:protein FAM3C isoform X2 [Triplophysa dalaica]|uniref:protein FAM3C isoform X2 n=1 Tax=Triplophysa dalaica TaxID=1582913 RepID=UPI0024DFFF81|nr:protein FAM3C isoform X2 [Triplophysa dalaica]